MGLHTDLCKKIPAYNEWHQNQHHKKVHWFLFLLVVALVFIFLFTQTQNVVKAFDAEEIGGEPVSTMSIEEMNQQIITLSNMLATVAPNKKQIVIQEIIQLSKIRKEEVRKIINAGEVSIDSIALPDAIRGVMPEAARSFVEQKKKISGKFTWIHSHSDEPNAKPSKNDFSITEPSGKVHTIKYQKNVIPKYRTDDTVTLTGYEFDNLFVALEGGAGGSGGTDGLQTQTAVTTKKIAVVLFNFQNNQLQPFTPALAEQRFFTTTDSVASYFNEVSFGKMEIEGKNAVTGDVYGWTTVPYDNTTCAYNTWASTARQQLGVSMNGYNTIVYMFPSTPACAWAGLGTVGGSPGYSFINSSNPNLNLGTTSHELGHNFGMYHAGLYSCYENGVKVPVSHAANCSTSEYGDIYDVMGSSSYRRHFSVYHKGQATTNWLNTANTYTVNPTTNPTGTYTIVPQEQATDTGIQSLRIPRTVLSTGAVTDYYYVELRKPFGFDTFSTTDTAPNGVLIRIAPAYTSGQISKLIDTNPTTGTASDSSLTVGKTFTDPYNGISITTLGVTPTSAEVQVTFSNAGCVPATPSMTINPATQSGSPGQALIYQMVFKNNDGINCAPDSFNFTSNIPTGWQMVPATFTETVAPGATITKDLVVSSPITAVSGNSSSMTVQMTGIASSHFVARALGYSVVAPDTTSPTVTITKPTDAQVPKKGKMSITTTASDNIGVAQISIYFDGVLLKTCAGVTSCSANKQVTQIGTGSHTVSVNAYDAVGNVTSQSKQVTK